MTLYNHREGRHQSPTNQHKTMEFDHYSRLPESLVNIVELRDGRIGVLKSRPTGNFIEVEPLGDIPEVYHISDLDFCDEDGVEYLLRPSGFDDLEYSLLIDLD